MESAAAPPPMSARLLSSSHCALRRAVRACAPTRASMRLVSARTRARERGRARGPAPEPGRPYEIDLAHRLAKKICHPRRSESAHACSRACGCGSRCTRASFLSFRVRSLCGVAAPARWHRGKTDCAPRLRTRRRASGRGRPSRSKSAHKARNAGKLAPQAACTEKISKRQRHAASAHADPANHLRGIQLASRTASKLR
eukprot:2655978-Pleurochrysis_carterae.AAC.1